MRKVAELEAAARREKLEAMRRQDAMRGVLHDISFYEEQERQAEKAARMAREQELREQRRLAGKKSSKAKKAKRKGR